MQELYHHGIRGQRWGKKNGPPYPLDASDHSKLEKKFLGERGNSTVAESKSEFKRRNRVAKKATKALNKLDKKYTEAKGDYKDLEAGQYSAFTREFFHTTKLRKAKERMDKAKEEIDRILEDIGGSYNVEVTERERFAGHRRAQRTAMMLGPIGPLLALADPSSYLKGKQYKVTQKTAESEKRKKEAQKHEDEELAELTRMEKEADAQRFATKEKYGNNLNSYGQPTSKAHLSLKEFEDYYLDTSDMDKEEIEYFYEMYKEGEFDDW